MDIKRIGGAGNKCANVAVGTVDTYMHPSQGLKYWDLCASEILIKAMGGYATNLKEERLTYHLGTNVNLAGLIISRTPSHHSLIVRRLGTILQTLRASFP